MNSVNMLMDFLKSNDLTQLTLGLDRDSELVQSIYDERNNASKNYDEMGYTACKKNNTKIGMVKASDYPEIAKYLVEEG